MKRLAVLLFLLILVTPAWALNRPWSLYEKLGPGASYSRVKSQLEDLSPLEKGRAFAADDFPFAHYGPIFSPNVMCFFRGDKLIGTYSFIQLEESPDEAKNSKEYKGFVKWADNNLEPRGQDSWRDGKAYVSLEVDTLQGITTLGFWWGSVTQEEAMQ